MRAVGCVAVWLSSRVRARANVRMHALATCIGLCVCVVEMHVYVFVGVAHATPTDKTKQNQKFLSEGEEYDVKRTLRLASFGALVHGTTGHWY